METLAYLHLALAEETPPAVSQDERLDGGKLSSRAWMYLLPALVALGVLGMARQTLAETIKQGAKDPVVTVIQERLQRLGYFNQSPTGVFGSVTREAVLQFQQENGLNPDGVVGERTMRLLFSPSARQVQVQRYGIPAIGNVEESQTLRTPTRFNGLQRGARGIEVRRLQEKLSDRGFDPGLLDGIYGTQTENAVRRFQLENDLFADGVAGSATLTALGLNTDAQENRYVVVVPISNDNTLSEVRAIVGYGNATLAQAKRGRYVNAGAFDNRASAESRSSLLRSRGLDARVAYLP